MKLLYVTRHFNHSGYLILKRLIDENVPISAILLHKDNNKWNNSFYRFFLKIIYNSSCRYYRCPKLKTTNSEYFLAKKSGIPIIWAKSIKDEAFYNSLKKLNPEIIVLGGGWHELIPKRVFAFPKYGCINTHPSLLPEFRGTSITRWQILNGVTKSGSSIHYVDDNFDTGGVLAQQEIKIPLGVTPQELFYKLGEIGADLIVHLLNKFANQGKQLSKNVEHNKLYYNYYKKWDWSKELLKINFNNSFSEIYLKVLANTQESYKYPGSFFIYNNKRYILRQVQIKKNSISDHYNRQELRDGIYVHSIELNGVIWLGKKNEEHLLGLKQIQRYDRLFKYRRAYAANSILNLNAHSIVNFT